MASKNARQNLIRILQSAYSGELAAAYAYRGHWRSLKPSPEKTHIEKIENEEWRHRETVARWLEHLDAKPQKIREAIFWIIGRALGFSCHISGWFMPMYFAGRLESQNSVEYEDAAAFAREFEMQNASKTYSTWPASRLSTRFASAKTSPATACCR